jgi:hypothetical protein
VELPAVALLDANVRWVTPARGLTVALTGRNLFATHYEIPITAESQYPLVSAPGTPITVLLSASYRY